MATLKSVLSSLSLFNLFTYFASTSVFGRIMQTRRILSLFQLSLSGLIAQAFYILTVVRGCFGFQLIYEAKHIKAFMAQL